MFDLLDAILFASCSGLLGVSIAISYFYTVQLTIIQNQNSTVDGWRRVTNREGYKLDLEDYNIGKEAYIKPISTKRGDLTNID